MAANVPVCRRLITELLELPCEATIICLTSVSWRLNRVHLEPKRFVFLRNRKTVPAPAKSFSLAPKGSEVVFSSSLKNAAPSEFDEKSMNYYEVKLGRIGDGFLRPGVFVM